MDRIPVLDDRNTTLPWLGLVDRRIARRIPDAKQVAVAITGWRVCECENWSWVPENHFAVGCEIQEGVLGVTDRDRILTKRLQT